MNYIHIKYFLNIISKKLLLACFLVPLLLKANESESLLPAKQILNALYKSVSSTHVNTINLWNPESLTLIDLCYLSHFPIKIVESYFKLLIERSNPLHSDVWCIRCDYSALMRIAETEALPEDVISNLIKLYDARIILEKIVFEPDSLWFEKNLTYVKSIATTLNKNSLTTEDIRLVQNFFRQYFPLVFADINQPSFSEDTTWTYEQRTAYLNKIYKAILALPEDLTSYYLDCFNFIWTLSVNDDLARSPFMNIHSN